jgi:hypothetical protein
MLAAALWILLGAPASPGQRYPILPVPNSPHGIYTLMQDHQSRLWMGTIDDVVCFDGAHFFSLRQYGYPREEIPNALAEDDEGGIWIATQGTDVAGGKGVGGLYRYQAGRVEKIRHGDALSVVRVAPGTMLAAFATEVEDRPAYGDLVRFQKKNGAWAADQLSAKKANHLTVDHQGTALFPCPEGWCELSRQELLGWSGPSKPIEIAEHAGNPLVERVLRDKFGCVWFRAEGAASYQCPGMTSATAISDTLSKYDSSAHLEETGNGDIFMLVRMVLGRPGAFHAADVGSGLPSAMDTAIVGKDGTIWIGAETGLYRFMYPFRLEYWDQNNGVQAPYGILRTGGKTFITAPAGVAVLSPDRSRWNVLPGTAELNGTSFLSVGPDETIFSISPRGLAQIRFDGAIVARTGYVDGGLAVAMTKDREVFLGGGVNGNGNGISRVLRHGNRLILKPEDVPKAQSRDLEYDAKRDTLWACDGKDLLFRKDRTWHRITAQDGLLDFDCHLVAVEPNGDVWLGYLHTPFSLIKDPQSGHPVIRNYTDEVNELVSNRANLFFDVDRRGWVWRGSNVDYVASSAAAEAGDWLRFDQQDGLPAGTAGFHSFFSDDDGSIWSTVDATVFHFSPDDGFATKFPAPSVFVSAFSIGSGKPQLAETIAKFPNRQEIVAHIGSLQFDRRNAVRLRYRILPEQTGWQSTPDFDIPLGKLGWGNHTLEVEGQVSTGPWSDTTTKSFEVLKPFWLTWPALLGLVLAGGLGTTGAYRWRKRRRDLAARTLPALAEWRVAALSPELFQLDGTVLDSRFEVGRMLARGGFATVAEGRDLAQDGRSCAIKIFRQDLMDNEWMSKRFQQEVRALENIQHPNVVRIFGHGTTPGGAFYLVMEFVDGETLRERLEQGRLSPQETADYLRQTGSALEEIHAHGICHRDLKPENLMIRAGNAEIVLIDFSIAIVQDPDQTLHGLSRAAGTLYYMAPEQSIGFADSSTDIYSLTKIVIEMLTGKRLSELLPDAALDLPDRVRELLASLNLDLSSHSIELMSSALEFDPSRRPKDAQRFSNQIAMDLGSVRRLH